MEREKYNKICPVQMAGMLDNGFRKLFHNPNKILTPYIKPGMSVLDVGCGPGFFTIEIAKLLNGIGKVIAVDLQQGMLDKIAIKIKGTNLDQIVQLHKCSSSQIGIHEKVDFVLACYMVHEVPDKLALLTELKTLLKPNGMIFIAEPKLHVSQKSFMQMIAHAENIGLQQISAPKVFFSRTVILKHSN